MPYVSTINTPNPLFTWEVTHSVRGEYQTAYRIQLNDTTRNTMVWDSGTVQSTSSSVLYNGTTSLLSDTYYTWYVTWWDSQNNQATWSDNAVFGTGYFDPTVWNTMNSQWIGCSTQGNNVSDGMNMLRVEFPMNPPTTGLTVRQARIYISGIGWHIGYMNGQRLGQGILEPAFTTYPKRVLYNGHDITSMINTAPGSLNAIAVYLGHGWPDVIVPWAPSGSGDPSWNGSSSSTSSSYSMDALINWRENLMHLSEEEVGRLQHGHTGYERRLRFIVSVIWSDGSTSSFVSSAPNMGDSSSSLVVSSSAAPVGMFMCGAGALVNDDLYGGCTYDARLETPGWDYPNYNYSTGTWAPAVRKADPGGVMYATDFPQIEIMNLLHPVNMWESNPSVYVFDFGQNFAGIVQISLPAPTDPGVQITIRHAEAILHPPYGPQNGSLYYGNLRSAEATDVYTTKGVDEGYETFIPMFTWHGFRYIEVWGLPFVPPITGVFTGLNIRSAVSSAGNIVFPSSANVMNQLQHAITWGQASNIMGNPSDCPQRDERLGWTGDSALTNEESAFNFDMAAFYKHWAASIDDTSTNSIDPGWPKQNGGVTAVVPNVITGYDQDNSWMSVFPTTVYTVYITTGDTRIISRHWSSILGFVNLTVGTFHANGGTIKKIFNTWGDWCPPSVVIGNNEQGPKPVPAFTAGVTFLDDLSHIIEMAAAINDSTNHAAFTTLWSELQTEFNNAWFNTAGGYYGSSPTDGAQTAQSCALEIGVVPSDQQATIVQYLVNDIMNNHNGHLAVGIIGQKYLTRALTANGYAYLAANITMQTDYPSFGWAFNHPEEPATTLWELWDGPAEGPGMNSRNHIMQGSIGAWLYTDVAGIAQQPGTAGWSNILIWPRVTVHENLPSAAGWHSTIRGTIEVSWVNVSSTSFTLSVTVPFNAVTEVRIPYTGTSTSTLVATEGGTTFFSNGAYVNGVTGITSASVNTNLNVLSVMIGGGAYTFALNW